MLDQRKDVFFFTIGFMTSWRHRIKKHCDVNSLFKSVFVYQWNYFPGLELNELQFSQKSTLPEQPILKQICSEILIKISNCLRFFCMTRKIINNASFIWRHQYHITHISPLNVRGCCFASNPDDWHDRIYVNSFYQFLDTIISW